MVHRMHMSTDADALKTLLLGDGFMQNFTSPGVCLLQGHIVAEVCDLDNEPLVKMVGCEHVQTVVSHDIIGRLMIQCARQHGLAAVWQNIMGFEGEVSFRVDKQGTVVISNVQRLEKQPNSEKGAGRNILECCITRKSSAASCSSAYASMAWLLSGRS